MKITFCSEWRESLREYSAEVRLEVYEAVIDYLVSGTVSDLKPMANMAFTFIKKDIDNAKELSAKRSAAGKKGADLLWQSHGNAMAMLGKAMAEKKEEAKEKDTQKEKEELKRVKENDIDKSISQKKFVKPTVEQVAAYCKERGNNISATSFVNFYESKGWMVGSNHMKDWKAAVRTWEQSPRRAGSTSYSSNTKSSFVPLPDHYDIDPNREVSFIPINQCKR